MSLRNDRCIKEVSHGSCNRQEDVFNHGALRDDRAFFCCPSSCRFRRWPAGEKAAADGAKKDGDKVEKGRDVYYKTEGIVIGAPAPKTTDGPRDYPRYNFESRVLLWFANQQHLYYGSFVLAVPIFCMVIEFMGVVTKDKAIAKTYDQLAYDFIKISLTAYSLTAILGGILIFTFLTLYPAFFGYLSSIFRPVMHIYALTVRSGERHALHLLLWMGQDERGVA